MKRASKRKAEEPGPSDEPNPSSSHRPKSRRLSSKRPREPEQHDPVPLRAPSPDPPASDGHPEEAPTTPEPTEPAHPADEDDEDEPTIQQSTQLLVDSALESFGLVINTVLHAVICISCEAVVPLHTIGGHINTHGFLKTALDDVIPVLQQKHDLVPDHPPVPTQIVEAFEGIQTVSGTPCTFDGCLVHRTSGDSLRGHFNTAHKGSSRPRFKAATATWRPCQQFTHAPGSDRNLFPVVPRGHLPSSFRHPALEQFDRLQDAHTNELAIANATQATHPLFRSLKWDIHIEGCSPKHVVNAIQAHTIWKELKRHVHGYFAVCESNLDKIDDRVNQRLISEDPERIPLSRQRLKVHQSEATLARYEHVAVSLIGYLHADKPGFPNHPPHPAFVTTHTERLFESIEADASASIIHDRIHALLLALWTHPWPSSAGAVIYDPTIHFMVVYHLNADGSWKDLSGISAFIAHLTYLVRITIASKIVTEMDDVPDDTLTVHEAAIRRTNSQWECYLRNASYLSEGEPFTLATARAITHLASTVIKNTAKLPNIIWPSLTDRLSLKIEGQHLSLVEIRRALKELTENAVKVLHDRLLFGLVKLRVEYDSIADNLSNTTNGYWFGDHPANPPEFRDPKRLLRAVLKHPQLKNRFIFSCNPDGVAIWDQNSCRAYIRHYVLLNQLCVIYITFAASGSPRIPELAHCLYRNTSGAHSRCIVAYNSVLLLVTSYVKQSANTGRDKLVGRPFSSVWADIMVQNLIVIRPFVELLISVVYPGDDELRHRYHNYIFINHLSAFTADDVTALLRQHLWKHSQANCGVAQTRQVNSAFRRHWCKNYEPDESADEEGDHIDLMAHTMGHSRWADRNRYAISASGMLYMPEEEVPKMIEHGIAWHKTLGLPPAGQWVRSNEYRTMPDLNPAMQPPSRQPELNLDLRLLSQTLLVDLIPALTTTIQSIVSDTLAPIIAANLRQVDATEMPSPLPSPETHFTHDDVDSNAHASQAAEDSDPSDPSHEGHDDTDGSQPDLAQGLFDELQPEFLQEAMEDDHTSDSSSHVEVSEGGEDEEDEEDADDDPLSDAPPPDPSTQAHANVLPSGSSSTAPLDDATLSADEEMDMLYQGSQYDPYFEPSPERTARAQLPVLQSSTATSKQRQPVRDANAHSNVEAPRPHNRIRSPFTPADTGQSHENAPKRPALVYSVPLSGRVQLPAQQPHTKQRPIQPRDIPDMCTRWFRSMVKDPKAKIPTQELFDIVQTLRTNVQDAIILLTTGGGKSFIPIFLSRLETTATLIILPLHSLIEDYQEKLTRFRVGFTTYSSLTKDKPLDYHQRLVIVSADQCRTHAFRKAISKYEEYVPVLRICFDEAHRVLLDEHFRPALRRMYSLRWREDQTIMLLSGSTPPEMVPLLAAAFGLTDSPYIWRTSADNPRLSLNTHHVANFHEAIQLAPRLMQRSITSIPAPKRPQSLHVCFVRTIQEGREFARVLNAHFYYSGKVANQAAYEEALIERLKILNLWKSILDICNILVATGAYGEGNDNSSLVTVLHGTLPDGFIAYHQQTNRGGRRDDLVARCDMITIQSQENGSRLKPGQGDLQGYRPLHDAAHRHKEACLRFAVTFYIDGQGVLCTEAHEKCSRCKIADQNGLTGQRRVALLTNITVFDLRGDVSPLTPEQYRLQAKFPIDSYQGRMISTPQEALLANLQRLHAAEEKDRERWNRIQACMDALRTRCVICTLHHRPPRYQPQHARHELFLTCPLMNDSATPHLRTSNFLNWKSKPKPLSYDFAGPHKGICWKCHLPSGQKHLHPGDVQIGCEKSYLDVLLPMAWAVYQMQDLRERWAHRCGLSSAWATAVEYRNFLVTFTNVDDQCESWILELLLWIFEEGIIE
ncbi:uncharacterized protein STEHIDRAFT_159301 [Stereum hirsutum FP-91666 SS1]|uniref:uncharacterized protein n=1 Tax=Stereum hirsutum (strain FP-91666) TaxID=721885 RepID=UPI0004449399|nr:uncharacterized protein STEHIDRAFT_159301 [Stereum hirsutum FP-91666 SS1]EIM84638.1 hypothetical protein STEHIDRAFT_159301 [Stereum hirsutum FP-91666 SS1]